jgi:hypothetical protein
MRSSGDFSEIAAPTPIGVVLTGDDEYGRWSNELRSEWQNRRTPFT